MGCNGLTHAHWSFKKRSGLEPVPRCKSSTHQPISRWYSHCSIRAIYSGVFPEGARCSSVVRSFTHGVDPLSYFPFQPVHNDWSNKGRGMCYPVCGMVHIKEPLLLIEKNSPCGSSGFPHSLSEWSFTICPTPYNRK